MKKSYFQRTYNVSVFLVMFVIISFGLGYATNLLSEVLQNNQMDGVSNFFDLIIEKLLLVSAYTYKTSFVLLFVLAVLVGVEFYQRIVYDSLLNYLKSIYQTIRLRIFLKQESTCESMMTIENQTANHQNPVMIQFNKAVRWLVVDVKKEEVKVLLKVPRTQQAQKLFKEMEDDIREEVSKCNPKYYFSTPNRDGNKLWFIGTKR